MPEKPAFVIDGATFETLDGFFDEFERAVVPGVKIGRNYNALADVLFGGMGTPEGGFRLIWKNAALSRERLGYAEVERLAAHRPQHRRTDEARRDELSEVDRAQRHEGPTIFDELVSIIEAHAVDGVELVFDS